MTTRQTIRTVTVGSAALLLVVSAAGSASAVGQPDPAYGGGDGFYRGSPGSADGGRAIATLPDGSAYVASTGSDVIVDHVATAPMVLVKLTPAGALDTTAGGGTGYRTDPVVAGTGRTTGPGAILVDRNGEVLVAGTSYLDDDHPAPLFLARFHPDLSPDTTFGSDGVLVIEHGAYTSAAAVEQGPDGSYVVAGGSGDDAEAVVVRVSETGHLDSTFGDNGIVTLPVGSGSSAFDLAVQPDNRVLVAGGYDRDPAGGGTNVQSGALMARLQSDGSLDPTFAGDGTATVAGAALHGVVRMTDGSYAVAGASGQTVGDQVALRVVRVSDSGVLAAWPGSASAQRTFVFTPAAEWPTIRPNGLLLSPDRRLVVTATLYDIQANYGRSFVLRTTATGAADTSFGPRGARDVTLPGQATFESGGGMNGGVVDSHGRVLVTGGISFDESGDTFVVLRHAGSVSPQDPAFAIRQGLSTWAAKSCGTTDAAACTYAAGATVRFEGRVWPVTTGGAVTLNLVNVNTGEKSAVEVPVSREGNYWVRTTPEGHVRARVVTPASGTTTVARTAWTYLRVPAVAP